MVRHVWDAALMAGGVITTGGLPLWSGRYFTQKRVRRERFGQSTKGNGNDYGNEQDRISKVVHKLNGFPPGRSS